MNEFPVEIVEKKTRHCYIYRLPENESKCHRFTVNTLSPLHFTVFCTGCQRAYKTKTPQPQHQSKRHPQMRKVRENSNSNAQGCSMETDPSLGHFVGCQPDDYQETIQEYRLVTEIKKEKPDFYAYKILKAMKNDTFLMVHRMNDNPTLCHRFFYQRLSASGDIIVACSSCRYIETKTKKRGRNIYLSADGFYEDPSLDHSSGCSPILYAKLLHTHRIVDKKTTVELFKAWSGKHQQTSGEVVKPLNCSDVQFENANIESKSGMGIIRRKHQLTYIYQIPNSSRCIRFNVQRHGKTSLSLNCRVCSSRFRIHKRGPIITRISDGFSMKDDPMISHDSECRPEEFDEVIKTYRPIDGDNRPQGKYEFPLLRTRRDDRVQVIYRLADDSSKCYLFDYDKTHTGSEVVVNCSSCILAQNRWKVKRTRTVNIAKAQHRLNESGFVDDPCEGHRTDCAPLNYFEVMQTNEYVDQKTAEMSLKGGLTRAEPHLIDDTTAMDNGKNFSRVYDARFFNENESNVMINNRKVVVQFERKADIIGIESCFLRYSFELSDSFDISTVKTTWNQGQMILTAERKL